MILLDEIEIFTAQIPEPSESLGKVPAIVSWTRSAKRVDQNFGLVTVNELRASFTAEPFPGAARVKWQGQTYDIDGAPMVRMRGAQIHHYTYTLKTAL